jgi:hypothetical protein
MSERFIDSAELMSPTGRERLRLIYVEVEGGADFHSLSFERLEAEEWKPVSAISKKQFQDNCAHRRWVAALHSFSPSSGSAIIQVAEGDIPASAFSSVRYLYSWRRWNLIENREIAVLKRCESPFDPL